MEASFTLAYSDFLRNRFQSLEEENGLDVLVLPLRWEDQEGCEKDRGGGQVERRGCR